MPAPAPDQLSQREFIALIATMVSMVAMAIDAMLPALGHIGSDLAVADANDTQLVISAIFIGLASAQMFFGPLSDAVGRKRAIHAGFAIFFVGTVVSMAATSFTVLLVGRLLQGVGIAGPRIVAVALVRDRFGGAAMARVMSMVMTVFILVPALAPAIGQAVLTFAPWRAIFGLLLLQGVVVALWFGLRQPETLPPERRMPLSGKRVGQAVMETLRHRASLGYTVAAGLIFGAFLGYLNSSQQIFQDQYGVGELFPVYFGSLALAVGTASVVNARLVMRVGMRRLTWTGLFTLTGLSLAFAALAYAYSGDPPLWMLMAYLGPAFFAIGILFGNFNSLAMEPLGHIAGTAAAVIGSLTTFISLGFGVAIGAAFDHTVLPLAFGFSALGLASLVVMRWAERGRRRERAQERAVLCRPVPQGPVR